MAEVPLASSDLGLVKVSYLTNNPPFNRKRYNDTDWYCNPRLSSVMNGLKILIVLESSRYTHGCLEVNIISVLGPLLLVLELCLLLSNLPPSISTWTDMAVNRFNGS
jgi:hypothetical protein